VTLSDDTLCRGCGYNLRSLPTDAACPECNAPVWVSTAGRGLRYAEPRWLMTIANGARDILYGYLTMWLPPFVLGMFDLASGPVGGALFFLLELAAMGWITWGLWRFATPEPGTEEVGITPRKWIRIGALASAATGCLLLSSWPLGDIAMTLIALIGAPVGLVGFLAALGYTRHVQQLAERMGDATSKDAAGTYIGFYKLAWIPGAPAAALALVVPPAGFALLCCTPAALIFGSLLLVLPHRILEPIRHAQREALRNWQGDRFRPADPAS
jgi:hypothetical protein